MSKETLEWLRENVRYGFTDNREKWSGNGFMVEDGDGLRAWWASAGFQDYAYPGAVPIEVVRDLFSWKAVMQNVYVTLPGKAEQEAAEMGWEISGDVETVDEEGRVVKLIRDETRKALVREDTGLIMNYVGAESYGVHQFDEWLLYNVENLLDGELGIASAGQLQGGAVAWVAVELPEDVETPHGFSHRPSIIAFTSHNSFYSTGYGVRDMVPVCDNSLDIALRGEGGTFKVKHSKNSGLRIANAREALKILYLATDELNTFLNEMGDMKVTEGQFDAIVSQLITVPDVKVDDGKISNQPAITLAENKQAEVKNLYHYDSRASVWKGSALGVFQAFNTWSEWLRGTRGTHPYERMMLETLSGRQAKRDGKVLDVIQRVVGGEVALGA